MKIMNWGIAGLAISCLLVLVAAGCNNDTTPQTSKRTPATDPKPAASETAVESETADRDASEPDAASVVAEEAADVTVAETAAPGEKPDAGYGHLRGRFVYVGSPPPQKKVNVTKDVEFCSQQHPLDESLVVNSSNNGLANVVVMLSLKRGEKAPQPHPSYDEPRDEPLQLDNAFCRFEPHIKFVRTGEKLVIANSDPVGHNTKGDMLSNTPFNDTIPANGSITKTFDSEERTPVTVSCSIHPWMQGYLVVQAHPYVAISDEDGNFEIKNIPVGDWTFSFWQEKKKYLEQVNVKGKKEQWSKGRVNFKITNAVTDLGDVKIDASQFK